MTCPSSIHCLKSLRYLALKVGILCKNNLPTIDHLNTTQGFEAVWERMGRGDKNNMRV